MSSKEQRRTWVISRLMDGELGTLEAGHALGLSERSIRRLRARMERVGLAGISVMVLAIANRQNLVDQAEQLAQEEDEQPYCGSVSPDASGSCIREVGHSGRHEYRPLGFEGPLN